MNYLPRIIGILILAILFGGSFWLYLGEDWWIAILSIIISLAGACLAAIAFFLITENSFKIFK